MLWLALVFLAVGAATSIPPILAEIPPLEPKPAAPGTDQREPNSGVADERDAT